MKKVISFMLTLTLALSAFGLMTVNVNAAQVPLFDNFADLSFKGTPPADGSINPTNVNNAKFIDCSQLFLKNRGKDIMNKFTPAGAAPTQIELEGTPASGALASLTYAGDFSNCALEYVVGIQYYAYDTLYRTYVDPDTANPVVYDYNNYVKYFLANNVSVYVGATQDAINKKVEIFGFDGESYQGGVNVAVKAHILPPNTNYVKVVINSFLWNKMLKSVYITPNTSEILGEGYTPPTTFYDDFSTWTATEKKAIDATGYELVAPAGGYKTFFGATNYTKYLQGTSVANSAQDLSLTYAGNYGGQAIEVSIMVEDWLTSGDLKRIYNPQPDQWGAWDCLFDMYKSQLQFYAGPTLDSMAPVNITKVRGGRTPQYCMLSVAFAVDTLPANTQYVKFVLKDAYKRDKISWVNISNVKTSLFGATDYVAEPIEVPTAPELISLDRTATTVNYVDISANHTAGKLVVAAYSSTGKLLGIKINDVTRYPYYNYVQRVFTDTVTKGTDGKDIVTPGYTLPTGTANVRAFFINDLSKIAPLAESL